MNDPARLWADPRLVYTVAAAAVALLIATIWLFRRRKRQGRQAGVICLVLSIVLHASLIFLVPLLSKPSGGSSTADETSDEQAGIDTMSFTSFDPDMTVADAAGETVDAAIAPLPVASLTELLEPTPPPEQNVDPSLAENPPAQTDDSPANETVPESLVDSAPQAESNSMADIDSQLSELMDAAFAEPLDTASDDAHEHDSEVAAAPSNTNVPTQAPTEATPASQAQAPAATVAGSVESDFANRTGEAKTEALLRTGGDENTEAAVAAALRFLAQSQRPDGAWDPRASDAGKDFAPLGTSRPGAGSRAESAITGLALLTMMGAGHTHQQGEYADNVFRGLAYLIRTQKPDGSMAGNASVYASTYSHGMAALAMCEAAAMTGDASAGLSARRAVAFTQRMQHPTTGGWRYTAGDPGDLSQLGWQAMVLDAAHRADIPIDQRAVAGVQRFLRTVRVGARGGLACYRRGEAPSRTMTAEALATRLLIGDTVPHDEISEAQRYLLQQPPGVGKDNYYYWYYATLALHQLQDDAWDQWNDALKRRLLATQRSDGGWSSNTLWGGYGGTVYTTSMAALCLETYYRHAIRSDNQRIANQVNPPHLNR